MTSERKRRDSLVLVVAFPLQGLVVFGGRGEAVVVLWLALHNRGTGAAPRVPETTHTILTTGPRRVRSFRGVGGPTPPT